MNIKPLKDLSKEEYIKYLENEINKLEEEKEIFREALIECEQRETNKTKLNGGMQNV